MRYFSFEFSCENKNNVDQRITSTRTRVNVQMRDMDVGLQPTPMREFVFNFGKVGGEPAMTDSLSM